jgi:hypothetical protein
VTDVTLHSLRIVDAVRLPREYRDALAPAELRCDSYGRTRELPRYFYAIESWEQAMAVRLTPNFGLWEFVQTDVREARALQSFPRYVPCALPMLALALEQLRTATGTFVHIAANGGYRSPEHQLSRTGGGASTHCWGTAANIFKIGDTMLDSREAIERYSQMARESIPGAWTRPYGHGRGECDDHVHVELGYALLVPRDAPMSADAELVLETPG